MAGKGQANAVEVASPRVPEPSAALLQAIQNMPPRNMSEVKENILASVAESPSLARACFYCKPVGKRGNFQQFSVGPSIRFAELAHQHFGYLWVRTYVAEETPVGPKKNNKVQPGTVVTETVVFDLKTGNITSAMDSSPVYSENRRDTAMDRSRSLSRRDAIRDLVRPQYEAIERQLKQGVILGFCPEGTKEEERLQQARKQLWVYLKRKFEKLNVSEHQLSNMVQAEQTIDDGYVKLLGILNWLNDGNADKVHEVFPPCSKPPVKDCEELKDAPAEETPAEAAEKEVAEPKKKAETVDPRVEFEQRVMGQARKANLTVDQINDIIAAEFDTIGGLGAVAESDFDRVHDHFLAMAEGKG